MILSPGNAKKCQRERTSATQEEHRQAPENPQRKQRREERREEGKGRERLQAQSVSLTAPSPQCKNTEENTGRKKTRPSDEGGIRARQRGGEDEALPRFTNTARRRRRRPKQSQKDERKRGERYEARVKGDAECEEKE